MIENNYKKKHTIKLVRSILIIIPTIIVLYYTLFTDSLPMNIGFLLLALIIFWASLISFNIEKIVTTDFKYLFYFILSISITMLVITVEISMAGGYNNEASLKDCFYSIGFLYALGVGERLPIFLLIFCAGYNRIGFLKYYQTKNKKDRFIGTLFGVIFLIILFICIMGKK